MGRIIRVIETGGAMLWIYDYIPLLFLLKVSITLFLLLFTLDYI